jgi:hypothetical protein
MQVENGRVRGGMLFQVDNDRKGSGWRNDSEYSDRKAGDWDQSLSPQNAELT